MRTALERSCSAAIRDGCARSRARSLVSPWGIDHQGRCGSSLCFPLIFAAGSGGALLEQVETWLFSEGCSSLWLTTDVDTRLRASSFYKEHGWRDWKIEQG